MTQEQKIKEFIENITSEVNAEADVIRKMKSRTHENRRGMIEGLNNTIEIIKSTNYLTALMDNWISVEDELPKKDKVYSFTDYVIVICEHKIKAKRQVAIAQYDYHKQEWTDHWGTVIENVILWTQLPKD